MIIRRNSSSYLPILLLLIGIIISMTFICDGVEASISLSTPYIYEDDIQSINEAFSIDECAPWGFGDHLGIDFMPVGNISPSPNIPFQAACAGTVQYIDLFCPDYDDESDTCLHQWQVNMEIECNQRPYSVVYAFETWSDDYTIGLSQFENIINHLGIPGYPHDPPYPTVNVTKGSIIGELIKAGDGAHVHFGLKENGADICPEAFFEQAAKDSILYIMTDIVRPVYYPHARMCYGLQKDIPVASIDVNGDTSDWSGINPVVGDLPNDDQNGYSGADIEAIYLAQDDNNLYLRMDLYNTVNPNLGNGPAPDEGRYGFYIENNGQYPFLYLGVAFDKFNSQWSLGYNGSNGPNTPGILIGPNFVGVNGNVIEVKVPLSIIGSPLELTRIKGEVVNCCISTWNILDETHCVSNHHLTGGSSMLNPEESIELLIDYIKSLDLSYLIKFRYILILKSAIRSINKNRPHPAEFKLNIFINRIQAQIDIRIPNEVAIGLIDAAQNIIESISEH